MDVSEWIFNGCPLAERYLSGFYSSFDPSTLKTLDRYLIMCSKPGGGPSILSSTILAETPIKTGILP